MLPDSEQHFSAFPEQGWGGVHGPTPALAAGVCRVLPGTGQAVGEWCPHACCPLPWEGGKWGASPSFPSMGQAASVLPQAQPSSQLLPVWTSPLACPRSERKSLLHPCHSLVTPGPSLGPLTCPRSADSFLHPHQ
jgi:hypothetical protein